MDPNGDTEAFIQAVNVIYTAVQMFAIVTRIGRNKLFF